MILHLPPASPVWEVAAADLALVLHIGGGLGAIASGTLALLVRKGSAVHRLAGQVFLVSMLTMATVGIVVSPMIGQPANIGGGLVAVYLVLTGWIAARRKDGEVGRFELACMALPTLLAPAMAYVGLMALRSPMRALAGVPATAFFIIGAIALTAAVADVSVLRRGGLARPQRLARHLWRLCAALLFADGSLFLGQPKVFPPAVRGHPVMFLPELFVTVMMIIWLVRLARRRRLSAPVGVNATLTGSARSAAAGASA